MTASTCALSHHDSHHSDLKQRLHAALVGDGERHVLVVLGDLDDLVSPHLSHCKTITRSHKAVIIHLFTTVRASG